MLIRRPRPGEGHRLKDLRLRALQDAPYAFASAYEDEAHTRPADWEQRGVGSHRAAVFVAEADDAWVGLTGGFLDEDKSATVRVWGMWVAPEARGQGVGAKLLDAVTAWARDAGATRLELCVTDAADPAARLYERFGFKPTGATGEMRPGLQQVELELDL